MIIRSVVLRQNPAYRPGNSLSLVCGFVLLGATAACHARVPEQAPSAPRPVESPRTEPVPRFWVPRASAVTTEYVLEQRARVVTTTDSGVAEDSVSLVVAASARAVPSSGMAGLIHEVSIAAPGTGPIPMPGVTLPYAFSASAVPLGAQYLPVGQPPVADPCKAPIHIALVSVRDLLIRAPDSLRVGSAWSDSGTSTTCRDGVHISLRARRQFLVTDAQRREEGWVLAITRTAATALRGEATRGTDTTRVDGTGSSTLRYQVAASTGAIISALGTGSVEILVRGALRAERALQTSSVRISSGVVRRN